MILSRLSINNCFSPENGEFESGRESTPLIRNKSLINHLRSYYIVGHIIFLLFLNGPTYANEVVHIKKDLEPFIGKYCYTCHDSDTKKGDLDLEILTRKIGNTTDAEHWQDILDQLNAGEMPPKKKKIRPWPIYG